ncbi:MULTISPECIES: hypothetical protein [unclassified Maridesulfovibrio]|uniref:hypothetical protein n=1 Tax=unclassified Maridesulfovibrio TaxID=2794999 RepID=UPI003B402433
MFKDKNYPPDVCLDGVINEELRDGIVGSIVDCLEELVLRLPGNHWDNISHVEICCVPNTKTKEKNYD